MTPFEVSIAQTVPAMYRFVRAIAKTRAKVSASKNGLPINGNLEFIVWLNPMYSAMFEAFCIPARFQFVSSSSLGIGGEPLKTEPRR